MPLRGLKTAAPLKHWLEREDDRPPLTAINIKNELGTARRPFSRGSRQAWGMLSGRLEMNRAKRADCQGKGETPVRRANIRGKENTSASIKYPYWGRRRFRRILSTRRRVASVRRDESLDGAGRTLAKSSGNFRPPLANCGRRSHLCLLAIADLCLFKRDLQFAGFPSPCPRACFA